jgi:hypothetical protein
VQIAKGVSMLDGIVLFFSIMSCLLFLPLYPQDTLLDLSLDIWTQVDLVRAINASKHDKEHFIQQIALKAVDILLLFNSIEPEITSDFDSDEISSNLNIINELIQDVFHEIAIPARGFTLYVIEYVLDHLESPRYITS